MTNRILFFFVSPIMAFTASLLFLFFSRDVGNYVSLYENLPEINLESLAWMEPFFLILFYFSNVYALPFWLVSSLVITFSVIAKCAFFYKYSENYFISIVVFLPWFFLLQDSTQIRVALALVFVLFAFVSLTKHKTGLFIFWLLFGALFHYSVIIFFALYLSLLFKNIFLSNLAYRKYFLLLLGLGFLVGLNGGLSSVLISYLPADKALKLHHYIDKDISSSFFSMKLLFSLFVIIFFICNLKRLVLSKIELFALHAYVLGFLVYSFFLDISVLSVRGSELFFFFLVFLAPAIFRGIKEKEISVIFFKTYFFSFLSYYFFVVKLFYV